MLRIFPISAVRKKNIVEIWRKEKKNEIGVKMRQQWKKEKKNEWRANEETIRVGNRG